MFTLFVDLDGVLADFDAGVRALTGRNPDEMPQREMWPRLARADGFYEHLDWMPDGRELWDVVSTLQPTILTGLPRGSWARPQKLAWCARELGPDVPVITCWSREKADRASERTPQGSTPVLVDDRERQRDAWEEMGGIFVLHANAGASIARLEEIYGRALR